MTRPEQLFLRPYGDSHGADHYAQYLRSVSEASTQVRETKSPGQPKTQPTQSIGGPSGNLDREWPLMIRESENRATKVDPIPTWSENEGYLLVCVYTEVGGPPDAL